MKVNMTAAKAHTFGGRRLRPGDCFEASRQDAKVLEAVKLAYRTAVMAEAPVQKATAPAPVHEPEDPRIALRAEYERVVGRRPFLGWDAETLREKIASAQAAASGED